MSQSLVSTTFPSSTTVTATAHAEARCAVAVSKSIAAKRADRSRSTASGGGGSGRGSLGVASLAGVVAARRVDTYGVPGSVRAAVGSDDKASVPIVSFGSKVRSRTPICQTPSESSELEA